MKTTFVATDIVRWMTETIELTAGADEESLLGQMDAAHRQPARQARRPRSADHLEHPRPRRAAQSTAARRAERRAARPTAQAVRPRVAGRVERGHRLRRAAVRSRGVVRRGNDPRRRAAAVPRAGERRPRSTWTSKSSCPRAYRQASLAELAQVSAADRGDLLLAASKLGVDLLGLDEDEDEVTTQ